MARGTLLILPHTNFGEGSSRRSDQCAGLPHHCLDLRPRLAKPGDRLEAFVEVADPDRNTIDRAFRWWRTATVGQEGGGAVLDTTSFARTDVVTVEVTPRDLLTLGKPIKSEPLVLGNSPPAILSIPSAPGGREWYEYEVKAVDPEGDTIRYRLETAPPGMTIEADTGHIVWLVASELTGTYKVRVVAEDVQGGTAFQEFDVTLAKQTVSKAEGA